MLLSELAGCPPGTTPSPTGTRCYAFRGVHAGTVAALGITRPPAAVPYTPPPAAPAYQPPPPAPSFAPPGGGGGDDVPPEDPEDVPPSEDDAMPEEAQPEETMSEIIMGLGAPPATKKPRIPKGVAFAGAGIAAFLAYRYMRKRSR
jgi:hypothetical protein